MSPQCLCSIPGHTFKYLQTSIAKYPQYTSSIADVTPGILCVLTPEVHPVFFMLSNDFSRLPRGLQSRLRRHSPTTDNVRQKRKRCAQLVANADWIGESLHTKGRVYRFRKVRVWRLSLKFYLPPRFDKKWLFSKLVHVST